MALHYTCAGGTEKKFGKMMWTICRLTARNFGEGKGKRVRKWREARKAKRRH